MFVLLCYAPDCADGLGTWALLQVQARGSAIEQGVRAANRQGGHTDRLAYPAMAERASSAAKTRSATAETRGAARAAAGPAAAAPRRPASIQAPPISGVMAISAARCANAMAGSPLQPSGISPKAMTNPLGLRQRGDADHAGADRGGGREARPALPERPRGLEKEQRGRPLQRDGETRFPCDEGLERHAERHHGHSIRQSLGSKQPGRRAQATRRARGAKKGVRWARSEQQRREPQDEDAGDHAPSCPRAPAGAMRWINPLALRPKAARRPWQRALARGQRVMGASS